MRGFRLLTHRWSGFKMILNEKEVMNNQAVEGESFEDRARDLDAEIFNEKDLVMYLQKINWKDGN